jgi:hypothetical protein
MAGFPITCGGVDCASVLLHVPSVGPWFADVKLTEVKGAMPAGSIELVIGDVTLRGTVAAPSDTYGEQRSLRVIAGGGGWGKQLAARPYANDAGTKATAVASDAAAEAGETMAAGISLPTTYPAHYIRNAGPASRTIEDAAGSTPWWVDYAGITQIGQRFVTVPGKGARVLDYDVSTQHVTLAVDSLTDVAIGTQLIDERWPGTLAVSSLEVSVTSASLRVVAWVGKGADSLIESMRALIARLMPQGLFGKYRYRVIRMNGDRVDLQIVKKQSGLPDIATCDMWPGVSGVHVKLAKGTEVAVSFLDGDRSLPIIDSFVGRAGPAATPERIEIGGPDGADAAVKGGTVEVLFPPMIFAGTIGGSPASGVVSSMTGKTTGTIVTGIPRVGFSNG